MNRTNLFLSLIIMLFGALAACSSPANNEPIAGGGEEPISSGGNDSSSAANCPEAPNGAHQLVNAAQGICFLYPDIYDVFQGADGSLTLYVRSLLNTEAPFASIQMEALNGRSIQEVVPDYPSDSDLATSSFLTIDLGGEQAMVLDNLPGQDINRRVIAIHNGRVVDIMIARIGEEYGEVGQQAEMLYQMMTESFQFIGVEPDAPLVAGPECPEASAGKILFTNDADGFCLLLPGDYEVEVSDGQTAVYADSLMDAAHPRLFITVEPANGRTLEEVTTAKQEEFADFEVMFSFGYMLDGVFSNQFDQLPGQDLNRQVVLVHHDRFYTLTFVPDDPSLGEVYAEMQTLYDTVMDSFSFLGQTIPPIGEAAAVPESTDEPIPAPIPEPIEEPETEIDPLTLARQLIEQVDVTPPEGRRVEPCEGQAPLICVHDGQGNMGYVELLIFPLTSYAADHPVRLAVEALPTNPAEQGSSVQQALTALAEEHLAVIAADRAITYPNDTFAPLPMEPAQMGALPALSFGFLHMNKAGEVVERYLNIASFDRRFIYWLGINYDPANVFTFVSDTAVTQFAPFFLKIGTSLPLPDSTPEEMPP